MSDPIDPIAGAEERRSRERRATQRRKPPAAMKLLAAPTSLPALAAPETTAEPTAEATFTAQMLGQTGQKRGLKGGPPVLEQARSAYLGAAYSGPSDRRPSPGRVTKTEF
ncbi:MAG TPA: hypothetical protein VIJ94_10520 [Caulobacteraceae bacterium]